MIKLCLTIFFARIFDVSLGTIRTVYFVKGRSIIATIISFFEILLWFYVAREALITNIDSIFIPISYALGYATGTLLGSIISNNFIKGCSTMLVTTKENNDNLINKIRNIGYPVSVIPTKKEYDKIKKDLLLIEVNKKSVNKIIDIIKKNDNNAFIITNETKYVINGLIK